MAPLCTSPILGGNALERVSGSLLDRFNCKADRFSFFSLIFSQGFQVRCVAEGGGAKVGWVTSFFRGHSWAAILLLSWCFDCIFAQPSSSQKARKSERRSLRNLRSKPKKVFQTRLGHLFEGLGLQNFIYWPQNGRPSFCKAEKRVSPKQNQVGEEEVSRTPIRLPFFSR